jgi:hypothetical protein
MSNTAQTQHVSPSSIRLARALIADAAKHGEKEDAQIEKIAQMKTPEEQDKRKAS